MATPFVQGRLRDERLAVGVMTECGHCDRELRLLIDSELDYEVASEGAEPLIFEPHIDWRSFSAPTIIHDY